MDMTPEQVGETLGIPTRTVYSRLKRAMPAMRAALKSGLDQWLALFAQFIREAQAEGEIDRCAAGVREGHSTVDPGAT